MTGRGCAEDGRCAASGLTRPERSCATPAGLVTLRRERDTDAAFLSALFAANAAATLRHAPVAPAVVEALIAMQHRAQTADYAARFPDALRLVVECGSESVGRLIEADEPDAIYIVDIAILPAAQARGIGSSVLRLVTARAAEREHGVRAWVRRDNARSLAMFRRCRFVPRGHEAEAVEETVSVEMVWRGAP